MLTFKVPPKLVSMPTPKPPIMTAAPILDDVEFLMSLTSKSLVEIDAGLQAPKMFRLPPMDMSPVLVNVPVCNSPVTSRPFDSVASLVTFKAPSNVVSKLTFRPPPTMTAPELVKLSVCIPPMTVVPLENDA